MGMWKEAPEKEKKIDLICINLKYLEILSWEIDKYVHLDYLNKKGDYIWGHKKKL